MRRYAVSIGTDARLLSLGDYQFDRALAFRAKAARNGRCLGYKRALCELNRAIETYSFAGAPWPLPFKHLSPLIRKNVRKND
ncbi:hypothetical protein [Pseudomonas sp. C5pp]|uniref:hypothetical protein n=1 Tax=Pseudomonas sp. C5pp TaxID=1586081 RepID=UPI001269EBF1|nr:hypothetical protein [Pseudomonas sp. C5pp]